MNILVLGSGVRECMIVRKLIDDSNKIDKEITIICIGTNNNPYLSQNCKLFIVSEITNNVIGPIIKCIDLPNFAIIGPESVLNNSCSNFLEKNNIPCIGPSKILSQIETNKQFARNFIDKVQLSSYSPKYFTLETFDFINLSFEKRNQLVDSYLTNLNKIVIKRTGLCGGKGVKVQDIDFHTKEEIINILTVWNYKSNILIEEKLIGEEFSLMSLTDGNNVQHFPPIQDYKRLNNNDSGPNTGSMGCVIDKNNSLPFLSDDDNKLCQKLNKIILKNLNNLDDTINYKGILYGSFIKCLDGSIKIIEFNSRFGDPEVVIALQLLESNFIEICLDVINGSLTKKLIFNQNAMIGVYLVPKNYPNTTIEKYDIYFKNNRGLNQKNIIYGSVEERDNHLYSLSSRSILYFIEDRDLQSCYYTLYSQIKDIIGNLHYRTDIGAKFLTKYEMSGVSIKKGDLAITKIKKYIESTYTTNVLGKYGDFGGQIKINNDILVSSIDGVGTKTIAAYKYNGIDSFVNLGKDIVNHSVNDILVQGAYPLFFMDYFGTSHLNIDELCNFVKGVSQACISNNKMVLLGGETAEMPGIYKDNKTGLVGCIVGVKNTNFLKKKIRIGQHLIGLPSIGPHTNGFSLINNLNDIDLDMVEILLKPHKSYLSEVDTFVNIFGYDSITGMCHITGGGLISNLNRIIPANLNIKFNELIMPNWCQYLMTQLCIDKPEMLEIYNCGIGYVLIIDTHTYDNLEIYSDLSYIDLGRITS